MTYSISFRSPSRVELARELLVCMSEESGQALDEGIYRDPHQSPCDAPGKFPWLCKCLPAKLCWMS